MIDLNQLTQEVINLVKNAVNVRVKAGWIAANDSIPLVTILASGHIISPIYSPSKIARYEVGFQIDVWHGTMREADQITTKIIQAFVEALPAKCWYGLRYRVRDIQEEGAFRKMIDLSFKVIG